MMYTNRLFGICTTFLIFNIIILLIIIIIKRVNTSYSGELIYATCENCDYTVQVTLIPIIFGFFFFCGLGKYLFFIGI